MKLKIRRCPHRVLYHHTSSLYLPDIMAHGLNRGCLAGTNYNRKDVTSLTANPNPDAMHFNRDKNDCRITVDVTGMKLKFWPDVFHAHGGRIIREFDPRGEGRKNWWCRFSVIPTSAFAKIEIRNVHNGVYKEFAGDEFQAKLDEIRKFWVRGDLQYVTIHGTRHLVGSIPLKLAA
jgi:hypothetical protein